MDVAALRRNTTLTAAEQAEGVVVSECVYKQVLRVGLVYQTKLQSTANMHAASSSGPVSVASACKRASW
jgi:hypothetical protein